MRTTLAQIRQSRLPAAVGLVTDDVAGIAGIVNQAVQQLLMAMGESGPWGAWANVAFTVSAQQPYITLPKEFCRAIHLTVSRKPVAVRNPFYEMIDPVAGLQPGTSCANWSGAVAGYDKGNTPTMADLVGPALLRVYPTDVTDAGKRVLVSGLDQNWNEIYSQDGNEQVKGFYLTLETPFTTSEFQVSQITGAQKDATNGDVLLKSVDSVSGEEVLLSRYGADEINPSYRRYYLSGLPANAGEVQVSALCKYEYAPLVRDTDFCIIGNIPALIAECKSIRYGDMDTTQAAGLEVKEHRKAIRLLNEELAHELGTVSLAVSFQPFGTADLRRVNIGMQ